jgi:hypothetical protein
MINLEIGALDMAYPDERACGETKGDLIMGKTLFNCTLPLAKSLLDEP